MNFENHPCFNEKARHKFGRIHLPVAPKCNIQCNYCNRKYDCVNESRPGVASVVLSPKQSIFYLDKVFEKQKNISVVGIAGPGDPFANPEETMETLRSVREQYPEMLLCVSTNGLNISNYVPELADLKTSHVTVTFNAIDPEIGAKIYSSVLYQGKIHKGVEGAKILLERQLDAIRKLKEYNITIKINTVFVPGINDDHIIEVIKKVKELGAEIVNIIPILPTKDTLFENIQEPKTEQIAKLRLEAGEILPQMSHCSRCRADAAGLINEKMKDEILELLDEASKKEEENPNIIFDFSKTLVAVASLDGFNVNEHLGRMEDVFVYELVNGKPKFYEKRKIPVSFGEEKWIKYQQILKDCEAIVVNQAGNFPVRILSEYGIKIVISNDKIENALNNYINDREFEEESYNKCSWCDPEKNNCFTCS
jgi:nitrogen fixation protein NifB